jgi:hypothetical protein
MIERLLQPPLLEQGPAEPEVRFAIVIVFLQDLAIQLFGTLKIAGAQSLLRLPQRLLAVPESGDAQQQKETKAQSGSKR